MCVILSRVHTSLYVEHSTSREDTAAAASTDTHAHIERLSQFTQLQSSS